MGGNAWGVEPSLLLWTPELNDSIPKLPIYAAIVQLRWRMCLPAIKCVMAKMEEF
jgi:hypothetical protein